MYRGRKIVAIAVARAASTRLPGKMTLPFGASTIVESALDAVGATMLVDDIVFATSSNANDDALAAIASARGLTVVRGSEHDVTARMTEALDATPGSADALVRVCCDNPLMDPALIDEALRTLVDTSADVVTPGEYATLPFGASQVVMTADCLRRIDSQARLSLHREHVENYCFDTPQAFRIHYQKASPDTHMPEMLLTLDYAADYERLRRMLSMMGEAPSHHRIARLVKKLKHSRIAMAAPPAAIERAAALLPEATFSSADPDLVVSIEPLQGWSAPAGCVHPIHLDDHRWSLAYGPGSPAGFPQGPLMIQHVSAPDAATALYRLLPYALPHLLGAPVRAAMPNSYIEGLQSAPDKTAGTQRAGFLHPTHAQFPPCIQVPDNLPADRVAQIIAELRDDWKYDTKIIVTGSAKTTTVYDRLRSGLPEMKVDRAPHIAEDPFSILLIAANTTLPLKAQWRDANYRRARVDILNSQVTEV